MIDLEKIVVLTGNFSIYNLLLSDTLITSIIAEFNIVYLFNSLPNDKILDSSILKEFADDNFKFDENGRKLSKWVENTVGKVEIARYEQYLLFPVFSKACFQGCHSVGMG